MGSVGLACQSGTYDTASVGSRRVSRSHRSPLSPDKLRCHAARMYLFFALTFFLVFLVSMFVFVWRGLDREGRPRKGAAFYAAVTVGSLGIWMFCLAKVPPPYDLSELKDFVWAK